jgi:predicted SnoaL-like aldol condensation-catalyzing enzyme
MTNLAEKTEPCWLDGFIDIYQQLTYNNLHLLAEVYHTDIHFQDPIHQVNGLKSLNDYFTGLYKNLISCRFTIDQVLHKDNQAAIYWQMTFCHKKLNGGNEITIEGHSLLRSQDNKIIYHRDHFDMGAMVYEQIPVLGAVIRFIKQRMN